MKEILLIQDLRRLEDWLALPSSAKPAAQVIALQIQARGGRRWSAKQVAAVLAAGGVPASRAAPSFGHDSGSILAALQPGGGLTILAEQLAAAGQVPAVRED